MKSSHASNETSQNRSCFDHGRSGQVSSRKPHLQLLTAVETSRLTFLALNVTLTIRHWISYKLTQHVNRTSHTNLRMIFFFYSVQRITLTWEFGSLHLVFWLSLLAASCWNTVSIPFNVILEIDIENYNNWAEMCKHNDITNATHNHQKTSILSFSLETLLPLPPNHSAPFIDSSKIFSCPYDLTARDSNYKSNNSIMHKIKTANRREVLLFHSILAT